MAAAKRSPKMLPKNYNLFGSIYYINVRCSGILMKCGCVNQKHLIQAEPLHCGVEIVNCNVNAA